MCVQEFEMPSGCYAAGVPWVSTQYSTSIKTPKLYWVFGSWFEADEAFERLVCAYNYMPLGHHNVIFHWRDGPGAQGNLCLFSLF